MDTQTQKKFKIWQWRTIIATMIGYAFFYFVRKNFSFAMQHLSSHTLFATASRYSASWFARLTD